MAMPVTIPPVLIVATEEGAMLHTPPGNELVNEIVLPTQTGEFPEMGPGRPFTVTITNTAPQVVVYETVAVPAPTPVTIPPELMVATDEGAMLHTPPGNELVNEIVLPKQTGALPEMGPGSPFTVTITNTVPHVVV
jgi:hypothetical protein